MSYLSIEERHRIVRLHQEGMSTYEIADAMGCSQSCVHRWVKRYMEGGDMETWPRHGNRALSAAVCKRIIQLWRQKPNAQWVALQGQSICGRELDVTTVYNVLHRAGVRKRVSRAELQGTIRQTIIENPEMSDSRVAAETTVNLYREDGRAVHPSTVAKVRQSL